MTPDEDRLYRLYLGAFLGLKSCAKDVRDLVAEAMGAADAKAQHEPLNLTDTLRRIRSKLDEPALRCAACRAAVE